jgi:hypothetical protein
MLVLGRVTLRPTFANDTPQSTPPYHFKHANAGGVVSGHLGKLVPSFQTLLFEKRGLPRILSKDLVPVLAKDRAVRSCFKVRVLDTERYHRTWEGSRSCRS